MKLSENGQVDPTKHPLYIASIGFSKPSKLERMEMDKLRSEVRKALVELQVTQNFFEMAHGDDQVEYAIYAMLAAERKYGMLINKAKAMDVEWSYLKGVAR